MALFFFNRANVRDSNYRWCDHVPVSPFVLRRPMRLAATSGVERERQIPQEEDNASRVRKQTHLPFKLEAQRFILHLKSDAYRLNI